MDSLSSCPNGPLLFSVAITVPNQDGGGFGRRGRLHAGLSDPLRRNSRLKLNSVSDISSSVLFASDENEGRNHFTSLLVGLGPGTGSLTVMQSATSSPSVDGVFLSSAVGALEGARADSDRRGIAGDRVTLPGRYV